MPVSSKAGKVWSITWIKQNQEQIKRVLDLGAGSGTYPTIIKKKNKLLTNAEWVGVEIWEPYIERFQLTTLYNKVINVDIRKFNFDEHDKFDLCILGDVLEHMTKDESVQVVKNALEHCKYILISIPVVHFPQGESEGNPYEVHIKDDWSDEEVKLSFPCIIDSTREKAIGVYLLSKSLTSE